MIKTVAWNEFVQRPSEATRLTEAAHEYAKARAIERWNEPRFETDGTELRILPPSEQYVAVIFGQAASINGMQGAHPDRIAFIRDKIEIPAWIAFVQGGKETVTVWSGWPALLGEAKPISKDPAAPRFGWPCRERSRRGAGTPLVSARTLDFPEAVPPLPSTPVGLF